MATARKIEPAEWNAHKLEIEALFLKQNKNVKQLSQSMKDTHGFLASTAQYIRKLKQWGFEKNTTSDNWRYIAHQVQKRKMEGKESDAFINCKLVPHKKIKKEISRYDLPTYAKRPLESSPDPPDGIVVRTPSCDAISVVEYQHIPWLEFQILVEPFLENCRLSAVQNFYRPYLDSHERTPATILMQQTSHNGYSSISQNNSLQPLGGASLFRSNHPPHLEAQTYQAQYIDPIALHNSSVGYGTPVLLTSHRSSQEAYRLLADCLDIEIEQESADFTSQISDCLDNTMIEAHCGDLKTNTSKLCGMSTIDASVEFVRYTIYFSSNNLLSDAQTDKFLKWTLNNGAFWILQGLLMLKVPTVELLASNLLLSAIRQDEFSIARTILAIGVDVNAGAGEYLSQRALLVAIDKPVQRQDIKLIEQLLNSGADPNAEVMFFESSALSSAILRGSSIELVKRLVEVGANPDSALYDGYVLIKLLDQAVVKNDFQLLRMLLDKKAAEMNSTTIRDNMLKKISSSDAIGLIQAVFELGRAPTESDCSTEYETGKQGFDLDHLFEVLVEKCENSKLDMLLVEARGVYCDDCFCVPASGDMHYLPQDPLLLTPALHRAIESDQIIHARVLLCAGALPDARGLLYNTSLQLAVQEGHTRLAKILLESGADVNASPGGYPKTTALWTAIENDYVGIIKPLLDAGADVNAPPCGDAKRTALQVAAENGYIDTVRLLIDAGADVNAPPCGEAGRTALQAAAGNGYIDIVRLLIDEGADVNAPPCEDLGMTALQAAAYDGYIDTVRLLIDEGADVNAPPCEDLVMTALQAAAFDGYIDIIRLLLDAGAEVNARAGRFHGRTALQVAATSDNIDIIRLLSDAGTEPDAPAGKVHQCMDLKAAVDAHWSGAVSILSNARANIDAIPSEVGVNSALHAALRCKDKDCGLLQKVLLEGSHLFDPAGKQALLEWAVHHGAVELVKNLLECGTDPNTPGEGAFKSALFEAVRANNIEIAAELMGSGADPNISKESWWYETSLQLAIEGEHVDMVNLLIARGATLNYSRSYSDNWLKAQRFSFLNIAISARNASIKMIQALIDSGANVDGEDPDESTPLQKACRLGKLELVKILLHNGASLNAPPVKYYGRTALQAAVEAQNVQLVQFLLQNGADVNAPAAEVRGATALQKAAIVGHLRITLVLLEAGADINAPAAKSGGRTALDAAAEHGRLDILHLLLKNDIENHTLAARCEQAAKLATENGRVVIARILRGYLQ